MRPRVVLGSHTCAQPGQRRGCGGGRRGLLLSLLTFALIPLFLSSPGVTQEGLSTEWGTMLCPAQSFPCCPLLSVCTPPSQHPQGPVHTTGLSVRVSLYPQWGSRKKIFFLIYYIYFWLHWVFTDVHGLSLVAVQGLLIEVISLVADHRL